MPPPERAQECKAAAGTDPKAREHDVHPPSLRLPERLPLVVGRDERIAGAAERVGQAAACLARVLDEEDDGRRRVARRCRGSFPPPLLRPVATRLHSTAPSSPESAARRGAGPGGFPEERQSGAPKQRQSGAGQASPSSPSASPPPSTRAGAWSLRRRVWTGSSAGDVVGARAGAELLEAARGHEHAASRASRPPRCRRRHRLVEVAAHALEVAAEGREAVVELAAERADALRLLGDALLLPAVVDGAQQRDQRRRARDHHALRRPPYSTSVASYWSAAAKKRLAREEHHDEVRRVLELRDQ